MSKNHLEHVVGGSINKQRDFLERVGVDDLLRRNAQGKDALNLSLTGAVKAAAERGQR